MKRVHTTALCFLLIAAIMFGNVSTAFASEQMNNFQKNQTYISGEFNDIKSDDWFYGDVISAYEYGIAKGAGNAKFLPYDLVSVSEVIAFGARVYSIYIADGENFAPAGGEQWYTPYVNYAMKNGIISESDNFDSYMNKPATRAQAIYVLANSLPYTEFSNINISINSLPDVKVSDGYYNAIIMLYRAGVLSGKDEYGTFSPTENVTRAETAATINRIVNPSARLNVTLKTEQTNTDLVADQYDAEKVAESASPCVFYIELYDQNGKATASGSGFFIASDGTAVTNYHVIKDAYSAKIVTVSGGTYDVSRVLGYDEENDLAIIKVDGSDFPYLDIADSDSVKSGQKIFCIGSPLGLDNSISEGVVSNTSRTVENQQYIQISAPISHGSSGGAVLDTNSRVIGVSAAGFEEGQNVNLAIPSKFIATVSRDKNITLEEFQKSMLAPSQTTSDSNNVFYSDNVNVPNYGYLTGSAEIQNQYDEKSSMMLRAYVLNTMQVTYYMRLLQSTGFSLRRQQQSSGGRELDVVYANGDNIILISIDVSNSLVIIGYNI